MWKLVTMGNRLTQVQTKFVCNVQDRRYEEKRKFHVLLLLSMSHRQSETMGASVTVGAPGSRRSHAQVGITPGETPGVTAYPSECSRLWVRVNGEPR